MDDTPITGIGIVADASRCPQQYVLIDRSFDSREDADLWRDGFFARQKVIRYICITRRQFDASGAISDVAVDIALINEREEVPDGFVSLDLTMDTKEKAVKKKQLCVMYSPRSSTVTAVADVIVLSRMKRPPPGYTLIGEVNSQMLCFKLGKVSPVGGSAPAASPSQSVQERPPPTYLPCMVAEAVQGRSARQYNPLSGVPFEINKKYKTENTSLSSIFPEIQYKSPHQIDSEFNYNFGVERSVLMQG